MGKEITEKKTFMGNIIINKTWAMPSGNTFTIPPVREFVEREVNYCTKWEGVIIDPFANNCKYGTVTNDLNPEYGTTFCMDALKFLESLRSGTADLVLYDPPYSMTQAAQLYRSYGRERLEVNAANMRYWKLCKDNVARILRQGGVCLSFGWNSNGLGKGRGFEMAEILLVSHGGSKNDTICCKEYKL